MMKQLQEILYKAGLLEVVGDTSVHVGEICFNTNEIKPGDLFVAVKGTRTDGHAFISSAVKSGAVAVVCESLPDTLAAGVTFVRVADSSVALAVMAANYYDSPSE